MEITIEEIKKKFESLSEDLKWAIIGANVDEKIMEIGKENSLTVEQMGQLALETNMVMLGFIHPDQFEGSVKGSLGLPDEKIKILVNAVNEKILKEIREKIMELHNPKPEITDEETQETLPEENINQTEIEELPPELGSGLKTTLEKELSNQDLNKEIINSAINQKISGSFHSTQAPKTTYTLDPSGKTPVVNSTSSPKISPVIPQKPISNPNPEPPKTTIDPYRENPFG